MNVQLSLIYREVECGIVKWVGVAVIPYTRIQEAVSSDPKVFLS